jgi:hypothetical protein
MVTAHALGQNSVALAVRPEDVQFCLEWAGQRLLSMQIGSPRPKGFKVAWPEYADDSKLAYGYTGHRLRPARPQAAEIALMDKVLEFPSLISDVTARRVVHARCLVTPLSNRYLYSWTKLAFMLHMDKRRVVRIHYRGLLEIAACLPPEKITIMHQLLPTLPV